MTLAIVGAGLTGLTAARFLVEAGIEVEILEGKISPGGRVETYSKDGLEFDLGAQYFTIGDELFREAVDVWLEAGVVEAWNPRVSILRQGEARPTSVEADRYVGVPGMSSLIKHLAEGLQIRTGVRIGTVVQLDEGWELQDEQHDGIDRYDAVILTAPAEETWALLTAAPALAARVGNVRVAPTWSTLVAFDSSLGLPFDAGFVHDSPINWVALNSSKPQRPPGERWVLQANPQWTRDHIRGEEKGTARRMLEEFFRATGVSPVEPALLTAHLWSYAFPEGDVGNLCLWDAELAIGAAGDWCIPGARIEGAYLSGRAIAERVLASR